SLKMTDLLRVDEALKRILAAITPLPGERVKLLDSLGRALAEDIRAETNLPPFPNSSMDGFAVRAQDVVGASPTAPVQLRVTQDIPAGTAPQQVLGPAEAARIMTGAPLPPGADAIVPVEKTNGQWTPGSRDSLAPTVQIFTGVKPGDYVRQMGEDIRSGQVVLPAGTILRAQEIGVLAALGYVYVPVTRQPRVAIVSTGDELVEIHEALQPGKIRDSNSHTLAAQVLSYRGIPLCIPTAKDTLDDVRRRFREALDQHPDVILSSAGVSVGAFDVVRTVLEELGHIEFWRINLRPGKPLAYGQLQGIPFFGLPGNPVSAMVTFDIFVRPVVCRLGNRPDRPHMVTAAISEDIQSDGRRSYLRVKLVDEGGQLVARIATNQSSAVLMSMVQADGLLIVPEETTFMPAGTILPVRLLRYVSTT
ncbi:MAG TPA: gephyrin-like molybdotransferase Glp, partial [Phototrophicaceae bacterium]|nr:gephyrin-like molybdotransferase Glp [Phototrophicaceae bacterium]